MSARQEMLGLRENKWGAPIKFPIHSGLLDVREMRQCRTAT